MLPWLLYVLSVYLTQIAVLLWRKSWNVFWLMGIWTMIVIGAVPVPLEVECAKRKGLNAYMESLGAEPYYVEMKECENVNKSKPKKSKRKR